MVNYVKDMLEAFLVKFTNNDVKVTAPASIGLFKEGINLRISRRSCLCDSARQLRLMDARHIRN